MEFELSPNAQATCENMWDSMRSHVFTAEAIRFTKNSRFAVLDNGRLRLPKIGDLDVRWSRDLPSDPSSVTIINAGWASFTAMLEYKAARWGRTFAKIDRFAPTSQTCSACGRLDGPKPLNVRSWTCPCGVVHDRDVNAAINVLAQGRWESLNACGARVRPASVPAPRAAMPAPRREAGIRPDAACSTRSVEGISVL